MFSSNRRAPPLAASPTGSATVLTLLQQGASASHLPLTEKSALILRRGPYVIAAGLAPLEGGRSAPPPVIVHGDLINLFDPSLAETSQFPITSGTRALLLDVNSFPSNTRRVLAASAKISDVQASSHTLSFHAEGIDQTNAIIRILSQDPVKAVIVDGRLINPAQYSRTGRTLLVRFINSAHPQTVELHF